MATERSNLVQSNPPLPRREARKENSALPAINVQMEQTSKQLTQLIVHLQRLNDQMQAYQEEGKRPYASESFQNTTMENKNNQNYPTKKYQSTEIKLKIWVNKKDFLNPLIMFSFSCY